MTHFQCRYEYNKMHELRKKVDKIKSNYQREARTSYIKKMRNQLLQKQQQLQQLSQQQYILYEAITALQQQNGPSLDIYVNIQQILDPLLTTNHNNIPYKLALYLFITLTSSDEVLIYLIENNAANEWEKMKTLARRHQKCTQYLYERMRVFLQLICSKYQLQPQSNEEDYNWELKAIFSEETTSELMIQSFASDKDEEYYDLISFYISYAPPSHILTLIVSGFAYETLYCSTPSPSLAILSRLNSMSQHNPQILPIFQRFSSQINDHE